MSRSRDDRPSTITFFATIVAVALVFSALAVLFAPELTTNEPTTSGVDSDEVNATDDREHVDVSEPATATSDPTDDSVDSGSDDEPGEAAQSVDNDRDDGADTDDDENGDAIEIVDWTLEEAGITDEAEDSDDRERGPPVGVGPPDDAGPPDDFDPFDD